MSPAPATIRSRAIALALALCGAALVSPTPAAAAGARVHLEAIVALASNKGSGVDRRLEKMARDFKSQNLVFSSYQVVGGPQAMDLAEGQSTSVALPNGKAEVIFAGLDRGGRAKVRVTVPGAPAEYAIPPGGEVIVRAGSQAGGSLFVSIRR